MIPSCRLVSSSTRGRSISSRSPCDYCDNIIMLMITVRTRSINVDLTTIVTVYNVIMSVYHDARHWVNTGAEKYYYTNEMKLRPSGNYRLSLIRLFSSCIPREMQLLNSEFYLSNMIIILHRRDKMRAGWELISYSTSRAHRENVEQRVVRQRI